MANEDKQQPSVAMDEDPREAQAAKLYQTGVMLIYGKRKSVDKAIKCIQKAITLNDSDYKYWQLLGEAYYHRGSLNPAINCFIRSLKLVEDDQSGSAQIDWQTSTRKRQLTDCTYSRLRMSDIRLSVGHLDEAAAGYADILDADPDNVAALVGLSKTKLQLARNSFSTGLARTGHIHCTQAIRYSLRAIKLSPHLCLTWKLASDCCLIQFVYGQRNEFTTKVQEQFPGGDGDNFLTINRRTCIEFAHQFLCKALAIDPFQESGCLWHNLGISLFLKSTLFQEQREREPLLRRSIKCLLKALNSDRNNSQVRNSIGVVAFNLNLLNTSQSFLIKSIQTNMSTSEVQFSNLGYIYFQVGKYDLASVAFARCQAEEPLYSRSWLGNALINEQSNLDNLSHLRHCHRLENNYESQLMYATKVTSLPQMERYKRDLISALDCMSRVINYNDQSLEANNTLGLLYERCNYYQQARLCFENASNISAQDSRVIFNKLRLLATDTKSCFKPDNNSSNFIKSAEKLVNSGNRDHILNYIYFLFNNGDYKNINSKMTKFMDKLPPNDTKSRVSAQILLGLAVKAEQGDFKSWLFKSIIDLDNICCIEALINLLCLMLLGARTNDQQLVDQIADDVARHLSIFITTKQVPFVSLLYSQEGHWIRLIILCSIFCLKDQCKLIRPLLALFPDVAELWLYMGLAYMFQKNKNREAIFCIKKAYLIGSTYAELCLVCDILLAISCTAIVAKSKSIDLGSRSKYLCRAYYKCPNEESLWLSILLETNQVSAAKQIKSDILASNQNLALFTVAIKSIIQMIQ